MDEKLICPYCGQVQETHEPDAFSGYVEFYECECCGKNFWYEVIVTREYCSLKAEE